MSLLATLARRWGSRPWFAIVGRAYMRLDRLLGVVTKGRLVALGQRELPSLLITTTGRSSGRPRTSPLLYAPDGDGYVVIGSNWGRAHHPGWSANLLAHPDAVITLGGRSIPVRARLIEGAERERLRGLLLAVWPAYATYERRAAGRHLRIFRLAPTAAPTTRPR
jgi:deazaflavin-dependent oxidoreductase (nitroreductase family)